MKNFVKPGDVIRFVMTASVVSGQLVSIGNFTGVCAYGASADAQNELAVMGVFTLPKVVGDSYTEGQALHMNSSNLTGGRRGLDSFRRRSWLGSRRGSTRCSYS